MYHLDLFSGIGGFALATRMAELDISQTYYSEIDEHANRIYAKNFPQAIPLGDIRTIDASKLPQGQWLVTGGFPCQDISTAGKRKGIYGERSGLFGEMLRVVRTLQPLLVIVENVPPLRDRGLDRILHALADVRYESLAKRPSVLGAFFCSPHAKYRGQKTALYAPPRSLRGGFCCPTDKYGIWTTVIKSWRATREPNPSCIPTWAIS